MSNAAETELSQPKDAAERAKQQEYRVRVHGEVSDGMVVIQELQNRHIFPVDYSIVPAEDEEECVDVVVIIPPRDPKLDLINQLPDLQAELAPELPDPEEFLEKRRIITNVFPMRGAVRRHVRLITDFHKPDAAFLADTFEELGGHVQGRNRDNLKLTADLQTKELVMAFCRGMPGVVQRVRANSPFTTITEDHPAAIALDVSDSPDYAPNAARRVVHVTCYHCHKHDTEIMDMLTAYGFRIGSIGSRRREDNDELQVLTIMLHGGSDYDLEQVLAEITNLIGVMDARPIHEERASQYLQIGFPWHLTGSDMRRFLDRYKDLHVRERATKQGEVVVSGSLPLGEAAECRGELAHCGLAHRPNATINIGHGPAIHGTGSRICDLESTAGYEQLLRDMLTNHADQLRNASEPTA